MGVGRCKYSYFEGVGEGEGGKIWPVSGSVSIPLPKSRKFLDLPHFRHNFLQRQSIRRSPPPTILKHPLHFLQPNHGSPLPIRIKHQHRIPRIPPMPLISLRRPIPKSIPHVPTLPKSLLSVNSRQKKNLRFLKLPRRPYLDSHHFLTQPSPKNSNHIKQLIQK